MGGWEAGQRPSPCPSPGPPPLQPTPQRSRRPVFSQTASRRRPQPEQRCEAVPPPPAPRAGGAQWAADDAAGSLTGTAGRWFGQSGLHPAASRWNLSSQMTASASPPPSLPHILSLSLSLTLFLPQDAELRIGCLTPSRPALCSIAHLPCFAYV